MTALTVTRILMGLILRVAQALLAVFWLLLMAMVCSAETTEWGAEVVVGARRRMYDNRLGNRGGEDSPPLKPH